MWDRPQFSEQKLQLFITEEQRIPAAEQDIPDRRGAPDIIDLPVELRVEIVTRRVADQPGARAVAAIAGATIRD